MAACRSACGDRGLERDALSRRCGRQPSGASHSDPGGGLRRTANVLIFVVAGALMLLKIPGVENVGASLLASAGLAGIIVGMAARPAVSNLLAGLQLALT